MTPPIKYIEGVGHGSYIDAALSDFQVGFRVADGYRALVPTAVHTTKDISRCTTLSSNSFTDRFIFIVKFLHKQHHTTQRFHGRFH